MTVETATPLPEWGVRADYANAVVRVGTQREEVAKAHTAYNQAQAGLRVLENAEAEMLARLVEAVRRGEP